MWCYLESVWLQYRYLWTPWIRWPHDDLRKSRGHCSDQQKKIFFDTAGEQTLTGTAASFVLTMQTAVGFVRSLYDNENHYRITWGFRTWEQWGGEGRATLGLINGLWRCPSGPLYGFFFLLFYPLSSFTTPLSFPSSVLRQASVKASRPVVKD